MDHQPANFDGGIWIIWTGVSCVCPEAAISAAASEHESIMPRSLLK